MTGFYVIEHEAAEENGESGIDNPEQAVFDAGALHGISKPKSEQRKPQRRRNARSFRSIERRAPDELARCQFHLRPCPRRDGPSIRWAGRSARESKSRRRQRPCRRC